MLVVTYPLLPISLVTSHTARPSELKRHFSEGTSSSILDAHVHNTNQYIYIYYNETVVLNLLSWRDFSPVEQLTYPPVVVYIMYATLFRPSRRISRAHEEALPDGHHPAQSAGAGRVWHPILAPRGNEDPEEGHLLRESYHDTRRSKVQGFASFRRWLLAKACR